MKISLDKFSSFLHKGLVRDAHLLRVGNLISWLMAVGYNHEAQASGALVLR